MSNIKKLMMSAGGEEEPVYVEDVFRSFPYDGASNNQTISF